jgi:ribulose-phosphate 3-epimerase
MKSLLLPSPPYPPGLNPPVLAPSILSADFSQLGTQLRATWRAGIRWIHLDIMDRHFVPNLTFGAPVIRAIRPIQPGFYFDAHLMVSHPADHIADLVAAGCQCITFHLEAAGDQTHALLREIRQHGLHAGIAIKPNTPVEDMEPYLDQCDLALVMTVEPGFGGQSLIPACLTKIRQLRQIREKASDFRYLIQVDGGINPQTAHIATAAGAEILVSGNAIYNGTPIAENVTNLQSMMRSRFP